MKFDHKHRPQTLNEIIFASADVKQVLQEYGQNRREKHLLLHGPKGTGKSVAAQLVIAQRLGECRTSTTLSARDNHLGRFSGR